MDEPELPYVSLEGMSPDEQALAIGRMVMERADSRMQYKAVKFNLDMRVAKLSEFVSALQSAKSSGEINQARLLLMKMIEGDEFGKAHAELLQLNNLAWRMIELDSSLKDAGV